MGTCIFNNKHPVVNVNEPEKGSQGVQPVKKNQEIITSFHSWFQSKEITKHDKTLAWTEYFYNLLSFTPMEHEDQQSRTKEKIYSKETL